MVKPIKLLSFAFIIILSSCNTDKGFYETQAINELDKMSETIGTLSSCSYSLDVTSMQIDKKTDTEFDKNTNIHNVYMQGPDKFYIHSKGTKGRNSYWYNGLRFSYYSHERHVFDTIRAQGNVIEAIDFLNQKYGIYFPAADFFYPTLTDDLMDFSDEVILLEGQTIDQKEYAIVQATNDEKRITIWINETSKLPFKFVIETRTDKGLYYEAIFSNWKLNPKFYDVLFEYTPSEDTKREPLKLIQ